MNRGGVAVNENRGSKIDRRVIVGIEKNTSENRNRFLLERKL